jgi:hypothetical protein
VSSGDPGSSSECGDPPRSRVTDQPNYRANLLRIGIAAADIDAVSNSLVDSLVATGDAAALRARVAQMHAAGADHVAVIPLSAEGRHGDVATARAVAFG